jgi:hypothetical protein
MTTGYTEILQSGLNGLEYKLLITRQKCIVS